MIEIWMNNHLVSDNFYNIKSKVIMREDIYKGRQRMLGLHLVLVTLHGQFTISIEQDN